MHLKKSAPDVTIVSSEIVDQVILEIGEDSLGSDHLPVSITLLNHKFHDDRVPTKLNLFPIDWDRFISKMELVFNKLSHLNSDNVIEMYNALIDC